MDIQKAIQEIRALHSGLQKKLNAATKAELKLRAKVKVVTDICKPVCVKAAEDYNRSAHLHIASESIRLGIAVGAKKIDMSIRLQYSGGHEPDEDMSDTDFAGVESGFRKILDGELCTVGIPLTLGTLFVPPSYYPK